MKILLKRASRIIPVFFVMMVMALSLVSLLPAKQASAANSVTQPIVWDSNTHDNAVSGNNVVLKSLGFFCDAGNFGQTFSGSGTSISVGPDGKTNSATVNVPADTETGSSNQTVAVPSCTNGNNNLIPASYAWVSSFPSGTNFVLAVSGYYNAKFKVDAQHEPVGSLGTAHATLSSITGAGSLSKIADITEIKVDTTKAGIVSAGQASNANNTVPTDTCPVSTWGLRWIACPIFEAANTAINKLEAEITSYLANDVQGIFGTTNACSTTSATSCDYYQAWNSFRVLAISLIIIVGIIMVVSEATGFALFDAYTIRKILPRLLVSVILISISWWLMKFVIQFFNNISIWLASLVSFPFHSVTNPAVTTNHPWSVVGQWAVILAAIAALGPFGLLSYAGTIFLAMAVGWITLVIRRMIIVFAIMSAPLFIACFIMPNTQKMGKFWRDGFIGLLLMGPVFTIAVTLGQITSAIASNTPNGDPFGIIAFAALVLPILSIPVLFSKIGGSVAGLVGFMNDRSKGGFDRLKNFRTEEMGRRKDRAKAGELFGGGIMRGGAANKLNSFTSKAGLGARNQFGMGAKGREAYDQRMAILSGQHAKSDAGQAGQFNDDMLRAQSYGSAAAAQRSMAQDFDMYKRNKDGSYERDDNGNKIQDATRIDAAMAATRANGGWGKARQVYAAKQLAVTGTGYDNSEQMIQTLARAAGDNTSLGAAMIGEARSASKRAGRSDLGGASYGDLNDMLQQQITANSGVMEPVRNTAGEIIGHQPVATAPSAEDYRKLTVSAFRGTDGATLARDKGGSIKNITQALSQELTATNNQIRTAAASGNTVELERHQAAAAELVSQINGLKSTASIYAAPAHSKTIDQQIFAPDRGPVNHATGEYDHPDAPNIIRTVTQQSAAPRPNQEVSYVRQDDGSFVQSVRTIPAAPSATPHMQAAAAPYQNQRNGGEDLRDPRIGGDE
ncbi:MAG: hypothetical protein ACQR33_03850 [Candidatus Saccharibacteria bacterium]